MKSRQISSEDRIALLGSSRGLGWATYQELVKSFPRNSYFMASRKISVRQSEMSENTKLISQDFSKTPVDFNFLQSLAEFAPTHLIYFAGGGPHGLFANKKWSDHLWALNTTFLYPAELTHAILSSPAKWPSLKQIILIGSVIAENQADPLASSYAAAKHALRGLVSTLNAEGSSSAQIKLFSPGYMQTDLLPADSQPRQKGLAENPSDVAKKLIAFIEKND